MPHSQGRNMTQLHVTFWGTRGSIPVSGPAFARHGGATTCVSLQIEGGDAHTPSHVILDGGTGLADMGRTAPPQDALIFQTHMHWDHVQGYPFFTPFFVPDDQFLLHAVPREGRTLREVLDEQMQLPNFPIRLDQMPADLRFMDLHTRASLSYGQLSTRWTEVAHPSGSTAYRFDLGDRSVVFTGDVEVQEGSFDDLVELSQGADILIMDAQYTPEEYESRRGWGHSTPHDAVDVAVAAGVRRLLLTHHDPSHDDAQLSRKLDMAREHAAGRVLVDNAYDRLTIALQTTDVALASPAAVCTL